MAKKNDFTKRANELLTARMDPVKRLGELLDAKAEKEAELTSLNSDIEKAAQSCIEAGWKPAELVEIGVPRASLPRRQTRTAALEPRTPDSNAESGSEGSGAGGGTAPESSS